jgi:hypothetical protein
MLHRVVVALIASTSIYIQPPKWFPESLACSFPKGTSAILERSKQSITKTNDNLRLDFYQFNWNRQTAKMSGNQSEVDVVILSANETAVTIAEYVDEGSLQVTVVYGSKTTQGAFNAVHSRHSEMMDVPIPSQYYGSCRRRENLVHKNDND